MLTLINLVGNRTPVYLESLAKVLKNIKVNNSNIHVVNAALAPFTNDKYTPQYISFTTILKNAKVHKDVIHDIPFRKICHTYLRLAVLGENKATEAPIITPINCEYKFAKKIMEFAATPLPSLLKKIETKTTRYERRRAIKTIIVGYDSELQDVP